MDAVKSMFKKTYRCGRKPTTENTTYIYTYIHTKLIWHKHTAFQSDFLRICMFSRDAKRVRDQNKNFVLCVFL